MTLWFKTRFSCQRCYITTVGCWGLDPVLSLFWDPDEQIWSNNNRHGTGKGGKVSKYKLALKKSTWKYHLSAWLRFHWSEQVLGLCLTLKGLLWRRIRNRWWTVPTRTIHQLDRFFTPLCIGYLGYCIYSIFSLA